MSRSSVCKMKLLLAAILSLTVTSLFAAPPEWVEGQLIVKPKAGLSDAQFEKILGQSKGQSVKHLKQINARVIKVAPQALDAVMRALSKNPHVDYVEKNPLVPPSAFTPNDPSYPDQWHLSRIQASSAWDISTGNGVTVAVLDAGVEGSHPDLASRMVPGRNVVSNNTNTSPLGLHGTAVAGAVAATGNNGTGVASVAWQARIMPIRITNRSDGWADGSDMVDGILWAADHGARVVNISYDIGVATSVMNDAAQYLRNKGGLLVMSAGNNNSNNGGSENPYIINVAATTDTDTKASFSNYGNYIDVSAPGEHIVTTWENGGYGWGGGTSFSSPVAAGVVALIKAANPNLSVNEVETILKNSADDLGTNGWDKYFGHGRVNAAVAVQMATESTTPSDTQAPGVTITSPAYNNTVSGNVLVEVAASDNTGVTQVSLYANGQSIGTDSTAPYQFSWDSSQVADGNATLTAYAYDAANNTGISSGVTVNVDNQPDDTADTTRPSVSITSPSASSSIISGNVVVSVNATDDTGVTEVVLYVNGQIAGTDTTAPYDFNWDSTQVADGDVRFVATAYDAANNKRTSPSVTVTVSNETAAVDDEAPAVAILNPANGSTVSGTVSISASASDNVGVTDVALYVNGQIAGTDSTAPYTFNWDSTQVADGSVTLQAYAYDAANNRKVSSAVTVNVDNQVDVPDEVDTTSPTVAISNPANGSVVSGNVNISASASDNVGVTKVELYVDGQIAGTDTTAPYNFNWDSTQVADGSVTLQAYAYDAANNRKSSSAVTVTVSNQADVPDVVDTTAPAVTISNPENGSTVSGTVSILVSASDAVGVTRLLVYVDNRLRCSSSDTTSISCNWNTRKLSGTHTITAEAKDAAGNSRQTSVSVSVASGSSKGKSNNK